MGMKTLLIALLIAVSALAQTPAQPKSNGNLVGGLNLPTPPKILTTDSFREYLVKSGRWSWNIGKTGGQWIQFKEDGTLTHSTDIMKYQVDAIGVVTIKHPGGTRARIEFAKDFSSYEGAWDKRVTLRGERLPAR